MHLNLNNNLNNKNFISNDSFIKEIKEFLNNDNNRKLNTENTTYYSIDRFIGNFAVCENQTTGEFINIPKILIDKNSKAGDIIKKQNNKFITDIEKTNKAKEEIKNLATSLFKRKNS